ncbi:hypothetical protein LSCM1_01421 [Leishmania martiniquensis]|uniref:Uncharacterized protein n=1 Tax=Leishmania martiniquensis TaxID=1580590 RepID=A0A836H6K3_9TRYP|nr:hypothetical protein LSCM1_01421 [Leishmania martiniquensis]
MPPRLATGALSSASIAPHRAVAFFTSADGSNCLVGLVASTPTMTQNDGTIAVLVQPRPLLLLDLQRAHDASRSGGLVTGQLVDASDPSVGGLITASIPSPKGANGSGSAASPLNLDSVDAVMTAEELREMRGHRDSLRDDLASSRARLEDIDELLRQHTRRESGGATAASTPVSLRTPSPMKAHLDPTRTNADEAAKAASAAEKRLLLARAGLRTVRPLAWIDLQRRRSGSSSELLVRLIETAAAPLHDRGCASFDDVVAQAASLPKRLAAVKSTNLTASDTQRALRFLKMSPAVAAVEKEHKTAAALYRWVGALTQAAQAQQRLKVAHEALSTATSQSPDAAWPPKATTRPPKNLGSGEVAALLKEHEDHMEYVRMAEDELAAIDALIAEAEALAALPHHSARDSPEGAKTIVPALAVPTSWVACALPEDEGPRLGAYSHQPRGKPIEFSSDASVMLSNVAKALPPPAMVATATPQDLVASGQNLAEVCRASSRSECNSSSYRDPGACQSTGSSQRSPRTSAAAPVGEGKGAHLSVSEVTAARQRAEAAEEKARLLEARLAAALQENPKEAEVQLLRDEVDGKRTELRRITEERDRLLQERCERSNRYVSNARRALANSARDDDTWQPGSGRYARQPSTPRDTVDRSVVEELEDQLAAAHQRISELLLEATEPRRRSPTLTASSAPLKVIKCERLPSAHGDHSHTSVPQSLSMGDIDSTPRSASNTPRQGSLRSVFGSQNRLLSAPAVTQEMYDDLQVRLHDVSTELETQRQEAHRLEEQLNDALHRRSEVEHMVSAQQRELEEVWERLEAAEARAEEQELRTQQRFLLPHTQSSPTQSQFLQLHIPALLPSSSLTANTHPSQTQQPLPASMSGPLPYLHPTPSVQDVSGGASALGATDAEMRSQVNEDAMTVATNVNTVYGSASRLSLDGYQQNPRTDGFPTFGGGAVAAAAASVADRSSLSRYSRGPSALQSRPVEQLSTIELRHEVHRLREEVERCQSRELRMAMELQALREKQKAERKRRRDARAARLQMLTRMQSSIADVVEQSTKELEAIPALLERSRAEAEALMAKRRMGR